MNHKSVIEQYKYDKVITQSWKNIDSKQSQRLFDDHINDLCHWVGDDDFCEEIEFLSNISWSMQNE